MTATKGNYTLIKAGAKRRKKKTFTRLVLGGLTSFGAELNLKLSKNFIKYSFL